MIRVNLCLDKPNRMTAAEVLYYYQKGESLAYCDNPVESMAGVRRCPYVMRRMLDQKGTLT